MAATSIEVKAAAGAYHVLIGAGTLDTLPQVLDKAALGPQRIVVSSPRVWKFHGRTLRRLAAGRLRQPVLIPDGERFKTLANVQRIYDALIAAAADRSVVVVAVGGGVVGDVVGFAAASYLRGVRLVQVPTTLLAQVDSAIGGKVGVNHPLGKNLVGAFHPPRLVVADSAVLQTLTPREFRAGLYEVVKYGIISSPSLFARLRSTLPAILGREAAALDPIIIESCRIKAAVVSSDEREVGLRRILNFGHTIGHALEAITHYRRFRHGEAIGYGMLAAMTLGAARGVTPAAAVTEVEGLIADLGALPPIADLSALEALAAIGRDKKVITGTLHFVAATALGKTTTLTDVTATELKRAMRAIGMRR